MFEDRLEAAKQAALSAGEYLTNHPIFQVHVKARNDYVTEADKMSETIIRDFLLSRFPDDGFFGEETGGNHKENSWIVDPIDGTTNFIQNIPFFTISIAYELEGHIVLGVVYCPSTGEMFTAIEGKGAYLNDTKIFCSQKDRLSDAIVGMSFAHRDEDAAARMMRVIPALANNCSDMRRMGSAALDLCYLACGRYDAFIELTLNIYDFAAGMLIAREAGAKVTEWPDDIMCLRASGNVFGVAPALYDSLSNVVKNAQKQDISYDAVIVLGHRLKPDCTPSDDLIRRINKTVSFWKQTSIPKIIPCGGITRDRVRSEAEVMKEMLLERGVPEDVIVLENESGTTGENIVNAKKILGDNAHAILISSDYHMEHALLLCEYNGLNVVGIGAYTPEGEYKERQAEICGRISNALRDAHANGQDESEALDKLFNEMMEEAKHRGISPKDMM